MTAPSYEASGYHVQAAFALVPHTWEIAARFAEVDPSDLTSNDLKKEKGIALSYYINKHSHKLQADWRRLEDEKHSTRTWEFRLQYQLIF